MKSALHCCLMLICASLQPSCQSPASARSGTAHDPTFAKAQVVLEKNCVHCHGEIHLPQMPALTTTSSLADLIGPGKWIVPGKPEASRLFQVVTLDDNQVGAMPPTGHKITEAEIATLRAWIIAGATIPEDAPAIMKPRGTPPRSR